MQYLKNIRKIFSINKEMSINKLRRNYIQYDTDLQHSQLEKNKFQTNKNKKTLEIRMRKKLLWLSCMIMLIVGMIFVMPTIVEATSSGPSITQHPISAKIKAGEKIIFSVSAQNATTYKWQYKVNGVSNTWQDVDATIGTTATVASGFDRQFLSINTTYTLLDDKNLTYNNDLNGYMFRCLVSNSNYPDIVKISDIAILTVVQNDISEEVEVREKINLATSNVIVTVTPSIIIYDGTDKEPNVEVLLDDNQLIEGEDYEVTFSNNKEVGIADVIITGSGDYIGTITENFIINYDDAPHDEFIVDTTSPVISNIFAEVSNNTVTISADIFDKEVESGIPGSGVDESTVRYAITLTNDKPAKDDEVWQLSNVFSKPNVEEAYVWVMSADKIGNYSIEGILSVINKDISTAKVTIEPNLFVYTGEEIIPDKITVELGKDILIEGKDYNVTYSNNKNAGTAIATITGFGKYFSSNEARYEIIPATMHPTLETYTTVYDGQKHSIVVNTNGLTDIKITYGTTPGIFDLEEIPQYIDAGTYQVYVKIQKDNYFDYINSAKVIINKKTASVDWGELSIEYTGKPQTPTASVIGAVNDEVINLYIFGEQTNVGGPYTATATMSSVIKGQASVNNYELINTTATYNITKPTAGLSAQLENYHLVWDGSQKTPLTIVTTTLGGSLVQLEENKHYTIGYDNNIEPTEEAKITVTGIDIFEGHEDVIYFTIDKAEREVNVVMDSYQYGEALPTPSLSNNIEPGETVYYYNTINSNRNGIVWDNSIDSTSLAVGTYYMYATIAETDHYHAMTTIPTEFKVIGIPATHPNVVNRVYNAETQVGVYGAVGITLSGDTTAVNVGTYIATGSLMPSYEWPTAEGQKNYTWKIEPLDISNVNISIDSVLFDYTGSALQPTVTASFKGKNLVEGIDYSVSYKNNVDVGTGQVIISGLSNYKGSVTKEFNIVKVQLGKIELENTSYKYTGEVIEPLEKVYDITGKLLIKDKDYTVYYLNNLEVGTAIIGAIGIGSYTGFVETEFLIMGDPIENAQVTLSGFPYVYDGTEKCPQATVVVSGKTLVNGRDYELTYHNNINAGENTAIVRIVGKGAYVGTTEKAFTIMKADRKGVIVPGKALILGQTAGLKYYYTGEVGNTSLIIDDPSIASATSKTYTSDDTIQLTGLKVGKSTLRLVVDATNNYNELVMNSEVTVFGSIEEVYPIYGMVLINDDAEYTVTPKTLLTLNVDFGDYMYISEANVTPDVDASEWYEYSTKMPYEFEAEEGIKTIYVWFKDKKGNISNMATDSIILDYDADIPAHDSVMLDQTPINQLAPGIETHEYHNDGIDMKVIFYQEDIMINDVRSGVDHTTIKYGYKENDGIIGSGYTWQDSPIIERLKYGTQYVFVTQAYDRAGNGVTVSDETIMQTERKYDITITLNNTNVQYDGNIQNIDEAEFTLVDNTTLTGKVEYVYYVDRTCTTLTTIERDGSEIEGGAPRNPGIYYVKAELTEDTMYYDAVSNVAELRIGWSISKTSEDNVFAYVERINNSSDEFILNIIGDGNMTDLDELLKDSSDNAKIYWSEYQDKITDLEFKNTETESVTNIGSEMFKDLVNIKDIEIPDTIKEIGDEAFKGCLGVDQVIEIPISVEVIGIGAFVNVNTPAFEVAYGNPNYDDVEGILTDDEHKELVAYPNGKIDERYIIPDTIETIKENAFTGADNLKNVVIPDGVKVIENEAFYNVNSLETIEIEDLMNQDNIMDLDNIGKDAFKNISEDSIIYTFSEEVAKKLVEGENYVSNDTTVYWPPVITTQPINMNGAVGYTVKFIVDTKAGNPETTYYQWFKVKDGVETLIDNATSKEYTTGALTATDNNTKYYVRVWNAQYYYDRGYLNSKTAKITMLDSANYVIERGEYNTYYFERLQDAFDFATNDDVIKPLKSVANEKDAVLTGNKSIQIDMNSYTVNFDGKIEIDAGSKIEVVGNGNLVKDGSGESSNTDDKYIILNKGELILNGSFNISNTTGYGIKSSSGSKLTFTSANITVESNAIYAEDAEINITDTAANIIASTSSSANAIELNGNTIFNMSAGSISIKYTGTSANGHVNAINIVGTQSGKTNISGGNINADITTIGIADAISNGGSSNIIISNNAIISGSRSGIVTTNTNSYGNILIEGGTISGGECGILNNANGAKVVLGKKDENVTSATPIIVGEKVAVFNTKEDNTLEIYDGILYSHGANVIYESLDNTDLVISNTNTDSVYTETGREDIITENKYSIKVEENVSYNSSTYKAAYLSEDEAPTITELKDAVVTVGENGIFEIVVSGGQPNVYTYQWEVSIDGGLTWRNVTNGNGGTTSRYTTPIVNMAMNGYKYRVVVSNGKTVVTSNVANLVVNELIDLGNLRPIVRIVFSDGRVIATEGKDAKKAVNMQVIVKSFAELSVLDINGVNVLTLGDGTNYDFGNGSMSIVGISNTPIKIEKAVSGSETILEYTYTYNLKVYANGIITANVIDNLGRDNTATQIVDLFYDLKVDYYLTELNKSNQQLEVIFFANKPVKPIKSITNSYMNSTYLDLISLDGNEYSYKYSLSLDDAMAETEFWFEDSFKNQASLIVEEILRVKYKDIKFSEITNQIDDLTIVEAYKIAQELEDVTEVNKKEQIQSRYGLNSVQSDMFMSRARDLGAVSILSGATTASSYDGVFTEKIETTLRGSDAQHNFIAATGNIFVAAAAKVSNENAFTSENGKYVDIILKDLSLYKGMEISDFSIDDSKPFMYTNESEVSNIDASTVAEAGFRATIIAK